MPQDPNYNINQLAAYSEGLSQMGEALKPAFENEVSSSPIDAPKEDNPLDFWSSQENMHLEFDDTAEGAEEEWSKLRTAYSNRVTDWAQLFGETAKEIAALPVTLIEGMVEQPNPLVWAGSAVDGSARMFRDIAGLLTESENPTSPVFWARGVINGLIKGKSTQNWRDEVAQFNQARKFNWHSAKIMNGDESLLEQYVDMTEENKEKVRSFINPKVAHAMGFIGLELPAIGRALMTSGSKSAIRAGASNVLSAGTDAAKFGSIFGNTAKRFENFTGTIAQKTVGGLAFGIGKALEYPASFVGNIVGGNIERASAYSGLSGSTLRNAATTAIAEGVEVAGMAEVKGTVGILGSLGLRTTSELLKEIGEVNLNRARGVVESAGSTGLTALEKVRMSNLSPTAKMAAKFLNITVDPIVQLSTAALKQGYKGALEFGALGYLNDRDRGAASGMAMGLVWGGYSGAVRHTWAVANGGFAHATHIERFDKNWMPELQKHNADAAAKFKVIIDSVDKMGSQKISSNVRAAIEMGIQSLDKFSLQNLIVHTGDNKSYFELLTSKNLDARHVKVNEKYFKGEFDEVNKIGGGTVPVLRFNYETGFRAADVGHEIMGHMLMYSLRSKGESGKYMAELFGFKENGGIIPDAIIAQKLAERASVMEAHDKGAGAYMTATGLSSVDSAGNYTPAYLDWIRGQTKELAASTLPGSKQFFLNRLKEIRQDFKTTADYLITDSQGKPKPYLHFQNDRYGIQFMFEEIMAGHYESLFMHTNLKDINTLGDDKPLRYWLERKRNDYFAKRVNELELAGIKISETDIINPDGSLKVQTDVYDNGVWHKWENMDNFAARLVKDAIGMEAEAVMRLSPEKQSIEARRTGKEYLFNPVAGGATMKGTKEQNEILNQRAVKSLEVLKALDDSIRPEIAPDEFGNESVDLLKMNDKAWDAMVAAGSMDATTAQYGKVIRDVIAQYEKTGFSSSNIFSATYWGDSHEIIRKGILQRLYGKDVPITNRMFVPYEMRLTQKITDANGKPLQSPKASITVTAIDYLAIHRRKIKSWSRPDVQRMFSGIDHMNATFDRYLINMMSDPSVRVPSEQLFKAEFGPKAAEVRNMCYEIFGAVKRNDEAFINAPTEGRENKRGPNFPFHSLKLDLLVDLEHAPGKPLPYHHGNSYDGLRKNLSVEGFERVTDKRFRNSQGYEIFKSGRYFKVYDPFGNNLDVVESFAKAAKVAAKNLKKIDAADTLPNPNAFWGGATDVSDVRMWRSRIDNHLANFDANGSMKSITGYDESGKPLRFDLDFVPKINNLLLKGPVSVNKLLTKDISMFNKSNKMLSAGDFTTAMVNIDNHSSKEIVDKFGSNILGISNSSGHIGNIVFGLNDGKPYFLLDTQNRLFQEYNGNSGAILFITQSELKNQMAFVSNSVSDKSRRSNFVIPTEFVINGYNSSLLSHVHAGDAALSALNDGTKLSAKQKIAVDEAKTRHSQWIDFVKSDAFKGVVSGENRAVGKLIIELGLDPVKNKDEIDLLNAASPWSYRRETHGNISNELIAAVIKRLELSKDAEFVPTITGSGEFEAVPVSHWTQEIQDLDDRIDALKKDLVISSLTFVGPQKNKVAEVAQFTNKICSLIDHRNYQLRRLSGTEANRYRETIGVKFDTGRTVVMNASAVRMLFKDSAILITPTSKKGNGGLVLTTLEGAQFVVDPSSKNKFGGFARDNLSSLNGKSDITSQLDWYSDKNIKRIDPLLFDYINSLNLPKPILENGTYFKILEALLIKADDSYSDKILQTKKDCVDKNTGILDEVKYAYELQKICVDGRHEQEFNLSNAINAIAMSKDDAAIEMRWNEYVQRMESSKSIDKNSFTETDIETQKANARIRFSHEAQSRFVSTGLNWAFVGKRGERIIDKAFSDSKATKWYASEMNESELKAITSWLDRVTEIAAPEDTSMKSVGGFELGDNVDVAQKRISELEKAGLVRVYGNGLTDKKYTLFELSDKDARLTSSNQGRSELTPFVKSNNPAKAFEDYIEQYGKNSPSGAILNGVGSLYNPKLVDIGEVKLSDIFEHDLLYTYFPELRDIPIQFTDSYGAAAVTGPNGFKEIQIGIRSLIPPTMLGGPMAKPRFFAPDYSFKQMYASRNPAASVILHEVQHHLQHMAGHEIQETFSGDGIHTDRVRGNFLKLLGVSDSKFDFGSVATNNTKPTGLMGFKYGYPDLSPEDVSAVRAQLTALENSPVVKSIEAHAKPLLRSTVTRMSGVLCDLADAGIASEIIAKEALKLSDRIERVSDAYEFQTLWLDYKKLQEEAFKIPEVTMELGLTSDDSYASAQNALGLYTTISLANNDLAVKNPINTITALRSSFESFCMSLYLTSPIEIQARETQRRAGMSSAELKRTPRKDIPLPDTTLGILNSALNSSKILTPNDIRAGKTASQTNTMKSIGDLMGHEQGSSDSLKELGKLSLVSYIAFKGTKELDKLGRFMLRQYGWEIDKTGKAVLTNKQYTIRGDWAKFADTTAEASKEGIIKSASFESRNERDTVAIQGSIPGMQDTYTIDDILGISGAIVEAEEGLSVGSSVMDNVLSNSFPSMIEGGKILDALNTSGFIHTKDALLLSGVQEISKAFQGVYITKRDLANLLAYYHKSFGINSVQVGEYGVLPSSMPIDTKQLLTSSGKDKLIRAASGTLTDKVNQLTGIGTIFETGSSTISIGAYHFHKGVLTFNPVRPLWVPDEIFTQVTERVLSSEYHKNMKKSFLGDARSAERAADALNQRIYRKMILIEPILKKLIENAEEHKSELGDSWAGFVSGLYEKVFTDALEIQPSGFYNLQQYPLRNTIGSTANAPSFNKAERELSIKRRGIAKFAEATGSSNLGDIAGSTRYGFSNVPLPMIGTAWQGLAFDLEASTGLSTSWTGNSFLPGGSSLTPYAIDAFRELEPSHGDISDIAQGLANESNYRASGLVSYARQHSVFDSVLSFYASQRRASERELVISKDLFEREAITADEFAVRQENARNKLLNTGYEVNVVRGLMDLFSENNSEQNNALKTEGESTALQNSRLGAVSRDTNVQNLGFVPQYGAQTISIGGKYIFDLDTLLAPLEDNDTLHIKTGSGSGIPLNLRKHAASALGYYDGSILMLMNGMHEFPNEGQYAVIQPTDRYKHLSDAARALGVGTARGYHLLDKMSVAISSGRAIAENGLLAHAARLGAVEGKSVQATLTSIAQSELSTLFGDTDGYFTKYASNFGHEGLEFNGLGTDMKIQPHLIGVASSVHLRHLILRRNMYIKDGNVFYSELPGLKGLHMESMMERAKTGEFNKPYEQLSAEQKGSIAQLVESIPDETLAFIKSELSSTNISRGILTTIGAMSAIKLAEKQESNPAAFEGTIKSRFLNAHAEHGLSIRNSINYAIENELHLTRSVFSQSERVGLSVDGMREFKSIAESVVHDVAFWHGFLASIKAHDSIQIPHLYPPEEAYFRQSSMFGSVSQMPDSVNQAWKDTVFAEGGYHREQSFLKVNNSLEPNRYLENVHGFNQDIGINSVIDQAVYVRGDNNQNRQLIHEHSGNSIIVGNRDDQRYVLAGNRPTTLGSFFDDIESNANRANNIANHVSAESGLNGVFRVTEENSERVLQINKSGETTQPIIIPAVKTNLGSAVRDALVKKQLETVARQLNTKEISAIAARFPATISIPTVFSGMAHKQRVDFVNNRYLTQALIGIPGDTGVAYSRNDMPRGGISWTRLSDGRIMINYTPAIDLIPLHDYNVTGKINFGLPYRRGLGFDTASGTLIPQSMARMLSLSRQLHYRNSQVKDNGAYLNGLIAFDKTVLSHYLMAAKLLSKDFRGELGGDAGDTLSNKYTAAVLNSNTPLTDIFGRPGNDITHDDVGPIATVDNLIGRNNTIPSYFTLVLPKDSKPEDVQSAIMQIHNNVGLLRQVSEFWGEGEEHRPSFGLTGLNSTRAEALTYTYAQLSEQYRTRRLLASSVTSPEINPFSTAENRSSHSISISPGTLRNLTTRNPNFSRNIVEMSNRVFSQDSGYSIPEAEAKLKINGDRSQIIKLMFPSRPELLNYAWDSGENLGIQMFRKSDKTGYFVSHNVITGMDESGNPIMGRKASTFRTESEAKAYIQAVKTGGSLAAIPKSIFGDSGFRIESMSQKTSKDTSVQGYISPHVEFSTGTADSVHASSAPDRFTVGNLDGVYSKKAAAEISKLVNSQDIITGQAPKQGTVMLSTADFQNAKELERIVRARSGFGISGSPITFSSSLMKSIAYGKIPGGLEKPAYTGADWFKVLSGNGVSKGEMRATGVAAMLYNAKDILISRDEFAQFAAAMYPTFRQIYRRDVHSTTGSRAMFPHRINSPLYAINRLVSDHVGLVSELESYIESKISNEQNPEVVAVYRAISDSIRGSMISALSEIVGNDKLKALAEDKSIAISELINDSIWDPAKSKIPELNSSTLWLFRQNMAKAFGDVSISQMAAAIGVDLKPFEMTLDKYNNTRSDTFELQLTQDTKTDALIGEYGYSVNTSTSHSGYSSGLGPYSENVLSVGVSDANVKQIKDFISSLTAKMGRPDITKEEVIKLQKMIESANNVLTVRENLSKHANNNNTHYGSGRGNFQISHIRATDNVTIVGSNVTDGPLAMSDSFLRPLAEKRVIPALMVEELQSDTYQKGTFGIRDAKLVLPTNMAQAEQMALLPKMISLEETIEKTKSKRGELGREFSRAAAIHSSTEYLWVAELMKNRFSNAGSMLKIALIKEFEEFLAGDLSRMFTNTDIKRVEQQTKQMFDGLLVKNGRKIKISKEIAEKYGIDSEFDDFQINPNHPMANSLFKAMGERYLGGDARLQVVDTFEFREEVVTALFGEKIPILEISNTERTHYRSNDLSNNSQTMTMLDVSLQAIMHDELFAASLPRLLAEAENNGRFSDAIFDFDALAKRVAPIVEKQINRLDSSGYSRGSVERGKIRYLINQILEDIKYSSNLDGREYVKPEITMSNPERAHGQQTVGDLNTEDLNEEFFSKKRLFKVVDIEDYITANNFFKVRELLGKELSRSPAGNLTQSRQIFAMTYLEAARAQIKVAAAYAGMTVEQFHNSDIFLNEFSSRKREARIALMSDDPAAQMVALKNTVLDNNDGISLKNFRPVAEISGDTSTDFVAIEAMPMKSRTLLGRHLEGLLPAILNMYKSREAIREISKYEAELADLKSRTKLDVDSKHRFPDVLPLGEDNAYRATSVNFYVMRALQARQEGIVLADARHHRMRYSPTNSALTVFNYGPLGFGLAPDNSSGSGGFEAQLENMVPYAMSVAQKTKAHGDIIGRIARGELDVKGRGDSIDHNGQSASISRHIELAIEGAFSDGLMMMGGGMDLSMLARISGKKVAGSFQQLKTFSQDDMIRAISSRTDEKTAKKIINAVKNNPSAMLSMPTGTFSGYGSNYGQPGWLAEVLYAGQKPDDIIGVRHDAFDAPIVEHANGTFNVIDRKTGKALFTGITNIEELHERIAQSSKYLGKVPIITAFLNTYKQVGFYMLNSHIWSGKDFGTNAERLSKRLDEIDAGSGNMFEQMAINTGIGKFGQTMYDKTQGSLTRMESGMPADVNAFNTVANAQNEGKTMGPAIFGTMKNNLGASTTSDKNNDASMAIGLHSMGIRRGSSTKEIAAAANQLAGFTSPVMVIKPKFPTESHKHEMRRMIVNGIPLMSVNDFKNPNIKIKRAMDDYKWITNYKPRPMEQDDDETTNR